jgi:hypothetical protein
MPENCYRVDADVFLFIFYDPPRVTRNVSKRTISRIVNKVENSTSYASSIIKNQHSIVDIL